MTEVREGTDTAPGRITATTDAQAQASGETSAKASGDRARRWPRDTVRRRFAFGVVAAAVLACLVLSALLAAEQRSVVKTDYVAGDGVPFTLYLPGEPVAGRDLPPPPAREDRPPVVVFAHGFSGDRAMVSTLSRRMAAAGYGVAALDLRGHGTNLNSFSSGSETGLTDDIADVLAYLEGSSHVDTEQVAIMGHSMGAGAALDFARNDVRPSAVIAVSGAWPRTGPVDPDNVLFLVAEGDPARLKDSISQASDRLADGTNARTVTIDGTDHITILWSKEAAEESIAWLDETFGAQREFPAPLSDPRLGLALLYLLAALVVIGAAGWVGARLAPSGPGPDDRGWTGTGLGLAMLLVAILLTMPAAYLAAPVSLVPLAGAGSLVGFQLIVGFWLLAARMASRADGAPEWAAALRGCDAGWKSVGHAILPAGVVTLVATLALAPAAIVFHNLIPTLLRLGLGLFTALLIAPFAFGFNLLLRQGEPLRAALAAITGRVAVLVALVVGASVGILDDFILLMAPVIALAWVVLETLAIVAYTSRRNVVLVAASESLLTGLLIATVMPVMV